MSGFNPLPPIELGDEYLNRKARYDYGFREWSRTLPAGAHVAWDTRGAWIMADKQGVNVGVKQKYFGMNFPERTVTPLTKQQHIAQYTDDDFKRTGYGGIAKFADAIMAIDQKCWDEFWTLKVGDTFLGKTCGSWHVDKEFSELIFTSYQCWTKPNCVDYADFSKIYGHSEVFIHAFGGIVKRYDPLNPPKCPFDKE